MRIPRTDADLASLQADVPAGVVAYLAQINEAHRLDLFSTVAVLDCPADLQARVVVTDGAETVDFGVLLYDETGVSRVLTAEWGLAVELAPGWAFLYEMVSDEGGCAVVLNHEAAWVPDELRRGIAALLGE